ncbi:hypothetical protein AAHC03_016857 [Spirometra sp. Aus1]
MPHSYQLVNRRVEQAEDVATTVSHSSVHVLRPTLKFTREERYDLPLSHQTLTVSTIPQTENGVEITATPPPSFSSFRISGLERDSKAQLIRRNMEYYETAEYRYTGPLASSFTTVMREDVRAGKLTVKSLAEDVDTQSSTSSQSSRRSRRSSALVPPPSDRVLRPRPNRQKGDFLAREQRNTNYSRADSGEEHSSVRHRDSGEIADQTLGAETAPVTPIVRAAAGVAPAMNGDRYSTRRQTAADEMTTLYRGRRLSSTTSDQQYRLDAGDRPQQPSNVSASSTWGQRLQTLWRPTVGSESAVYPRSNSDVASESTSSQRNWVVSSMFGLGDSSHKGVERSFGEESVPMTSTMRAAHSTARSPSVFHTERHQAGEDEGRVHGGGIIHFLTTGISSLILNMFAVIFVIAYCLWQCVLSAFNGLAKLKNRFVSSLLVFTHLFRPTAATPSASSSVRLSKPRLAPSENIYSSAYRPISRRGTSYSETDSSVIKPRKSVGGIVCCGLRSCCFLLWLPLLLAFLFLLAFLLRPAGEKLLPESEPQWLFGVLPSDAVCRRALPFHLYDQNSVTSRARLRLHCLRQEYIPQTLLVFEKLNSWWSSLSWPTLTPLSPSSPVVTPIGSSDDLNSLKAQLKSLNSDVGAKLVEISARLDRIDYQSSVITDAMARLRSESESRLADLDSRAAAVSQHSPSNDSLLESAVAVLRQQVAVLSSQLKQLRESRVPAPAPEIAVEAIVDQLVKQAALVSTTTLETKLAEIRQQIASSSQPDGSRTVPEKTELAAKLLRLSETVTELQAALVQHRSDLSSQLTRMKEELESHRRSFDGLLTKSEENAESRLAALRAELTTSTQKHTEDSLSRLMSQVGSISEKVAAMESLNHNLQTAIDGLANEVKLGVDSNSREITNLKQSTSEQIRTLEDELKAAFSQQLTTNLREKILAELNSPDNSDINSRLVSIIKSTVIETLQASFRGVSPKVGEESLSSIHSAINAALSLYAADRTGLVDFALGSAGGTVVHTRCTRTYNKGSTAFSVFGIPLFYIRNSPNTILEPSNQPGDCWAFEGTEGQAVIRLAVPVHISGVSLEHIPRSLSLHGNINSAPREFQIKALDSEYSESGELLGTFKYDETSTPIQFFPVQPKNASKPVQFIEFAVLNNYGNPEYTCVYRLRVHGSAAVIGQT